MRLSVPAWALILFCLVVGFAIGIVVHGAINERYQNCSTCHGTGRVPRTDK